MKGKKPHPLLDESRDAIQTELSSVEKSFDHSVETNGDSEKENHVDNTIKGKRDCGITVAEPFLLPPAFVKGKL